MGFLWGLGGIAVLLAVAFLVSVDRKRIRIRTVGAALLVQILFGAIVLYWPMGRSALQATGDVVQKVIDASHDGIVFVFGPLLDNGFAFALNVLPVIIFIAALTSVLYYIGVLQWVVKIVGGAFAKLFGTTTVESMNTAANIFLGHTEAPLLIKPYLKKLTQSELFAVMTGGMATVSGAVLVGYSLMGVPLDYLLAAAFMAAPGALVFAKMMMPAGASLAAARAPRPSWFKLPWGKNKADATPVAAAAAEPSEAGAPTRTPMSESADADEEDRARNVIDAAARGAGDGLQLVLNIGAMLIAFISLIALINLILGGLGSLFGAGDLTLQQILGWIFAPVMFVLGVPWAEAAQAGSFVGQKLVLNEFVAFSELGPVLDTFSAKTQAIVTFSLCGFANFAAIAMQIGGIGSLAPNQRPLIAQLGMRAVFAGTMANLTSGAIAGIMIGLTL